METTRSRNSLGTKVIKFILLLSVAIIVLWFILPMIFGIFGPIVRALPFTTPTNYIVADYAGVFFLIATGLATLYYTFKLTWR